MLSALFVLAGMHIPVSDAGRALDPFGYALLVLAGVSMAFARRCPRLVVAVVTTVLACYYARHYPNGPVLATGWISLLALGWRTDRRTALIGAATMCVVLSVVVTIVHGASIMPAVFVGWSAAAVFLGDALRNRRSYLRELEEHARYLERTRDEEALRRVAEDRLRIARDLHDSVAHAMATINVQAGAAAHVIDQRPEAAKHALGAIARASGEVLEELAAMVAVLRADGESAERAPTPGLSDIAGLADDAEAAGLDVSLTVEGPVGEISPAVSTAAYRIVQESLTNVIKHAGAASVVVDVRASHDRGLAVSIRDDGRGLSSPTVGRGRGITGMRERAESTGGHLVAEPLPDRGFVVRASWEGAR